jgi:putative ABC transport system substrate-binding protein
MHDLGYVEGRNIAFEVGSIPSVISDLLRAKVDIIVAAATPAIRAAQAATQTIAIVMIPADPLGSGLIAGLAHPGGNTTGLSILSAELTIKRLKLLKEVMPQAVRIAISPAATSP